MFSPVTYSCTARELRQCTSYISHIIFQVYVLWKVFRINRRLFAESCENKVYFFSLDRIYSISPFKTFRSLFYLFLSLYYARKLLFLTVVGSLHILAVVHIYFFTHSWLFACYYVRLFLNAYRLCHSRAVVFKINIRLVKNRTASLKDRDVIPSTQHLLISRFVL